MLAALTKQVSYGPLDKCKRLPEIGYFDWFGNDRQKAWAGLGSMKKHHAMEELVLLVDKCIPVFWLVLLSRKIRIMIYIQYIKTLKISTDQIS